MRMATFCFWINKILVLAVIMQVSKACTYKDALKSRRDKTGGLGRVLVGSIGFVGQSGRGSKRVIFKRVNRFAGWVGLRVRLSLPVFFNFFFFFFEIDAIRQFFMSSLIVIRFSLVILLLITTKHLTWYSNLVQLLFQLSRS